MKTFSKNPLMKTFSFLCLFLPLIFGAPRELFGGDLIQLYKETKSIYIRNRGPYDHEFNESYRKLKELLNEWWNGNPIELFNVLNQIATPQIAHFFFEEIIFIMSPELVNDWADWEDHLDPNSSFELFLSKSQRLICGLYRYDAELLKEVLPIIQSIQSRNLHHIKGYIDRKEAAHWISEFDLISHTFDSGNVRTLLRLYEELRLMALKHNGHIPVMEKDRFIIWRSLHLFKIYCNQFYDKHWKDLDEGKFTSLPREVVYHIVVDRSKEVIFRLFRFPKEYFFSDFCHFNNDFSDIVDIFETENDYIEEVTFSEFPLEDNPLFANFLHDSINNPKEYSPHLGEKHFWLINCFLYVLPMIDRPEIL
jgi:hypothetical protein